MLHYDVAVGTDAQETPLPEIASRYMTSLLLRKRLYYAVPSNVPRLSANVSQYYAMY
jgi:hypothetical protein